MTSPAAKFIPYGAIIQEFNIAGQNIALNFPTADLYPQYNAPNFGATIGRVANRIQDGRLTLNGKQIQLFKTDGVNSIHGGKDGWGKKVFDGPKTVQRNGKQALEFKYLSKDGDENYPGTVELRVYYTVEQEGQGPSAKTVLAMEYECEFVGNECEETVINLTNHNYFNISDGASIEGTEAVLATNLTLPINSVGIPVSGPVPYTATEVNKPFTLGATSPDIDDTFIVNPDPKSVPIDTRNQPLKLNAAFKHPRSGLHLEVHSTEPAFQFYTGRYLEVPAVGGAPARHPRDAFCVEPHRYVNAINVPEWRHMVLLKRGQTYGSRIVYKAWKA